jgi:hypothetical protein
MGVRRLENHFIDATADQSPRMLFLRQKLLTRRLDLDELDPHDWILSGGRRRTAPSGMDSDIQIFYIKQHSGSLAVLQERNIDGLAL